MAPAERHLQHFGAVTKLVQASRDHHCRSIAVADLYEDASALTTRMAVDLCQNYSLTSTLFLFETGRHRWRQFRPKGIEVYLGAPASVQAHPANKFASPSNRALNGNSAREPEDSNEVELVPDAPFSLLRATIDELESESSMLILNAPPLLADSSAAMALSLVPRVILTVPAETDRDDLILARKVLEAMNVELMGTIMTGYRNPLPKWLDYLLGYR